MTDSDYDKYKKYKNKYMSLKNELSVIQTGGNKLEKAWIWFTLDEKTRTDIIRSASDIIQKRNLNINLKKQNQLHISLITISASLEDRTRLNDIVKRQLAQLLYGRQYQIILIANSEMIYLPKNDPNYMAISFSEHTNFLSIIRFTLRQEIINYFKNKYVNVYDIITKQNQQYKNYEVLTYDALRLFDANNNEICNFRLDEFENQYHISLNAKFTPEQKQQIINIKYSLPSPVDRPLYFDNIKPDMFEYKEKTIDKPTETPIQTPIYNDNNVDRRPSFLFIHNIKINGQPVLCNTGQVNTVVQFLERSYNLKPNDIRISVLGGNNPPCGDKINKNLLQIHILRNIPTLDFSNSDQIIVNSKIDMYSNDMIYMKIQKNK